MADPDIPMAFATPIPPPSFNPTTSSTTTTTTYIPPPGAMNTSTSTYTSSASAPPRPTLHAATTLNGGRSSRVILPTGGQEHAEIDERTIKMLLAQGYTKGLAQSIRTNKLALPLSIWVVDNSGSMQNRDGHRIVDTTNKNQVKFAPCTRWAEMQQTVEYHAQLAAVLLSPTVFRLLNDPGRTAGPQQFSVAEKGQSYIDEDLATAQQTMENTCPGGVTPLIPHLQEIRENILALEPKLRREGTKVVLVLATDGLPTNERGISDDYVRRGFVEALRALEGLPVWVVVRLCTDEDEVVEFWNSLDDQLELSLEVLDDFQSEAKEVHEHNPWLNYGLPLHRMREMGFHHRVFDLLDERRLMKDELRDFFRLLFGDGAMDGVCDPEADWKKFYQRVSEVVHAENKTWNPMTKRMDYWVDLKRLKKEYGGGGWFW